jgi:hypothetical protein
MYEDSRKPGRPKGAKQKTSTPGKKRAEKFLEIKFDNSLRPTAAARVVADQFSVATEQVFKDAKRHEQTIVNGILKEAKEIERDVETRRAIMEMGPHQPKDARTLIFHIAANALKGYTR